MATSIQWPFFLVDSPYLTLVLTSLQQPLSFVPKLAVVERFNCISIKPVVVGMARTCDFHGTVCHRIQNSNFVTKPLYFYA